jgi:plasmid stability protein
MSKMIQIRNVPDDIHRALVQRAEREGMSLSGFLLREVAKVAERPSLAEIIARAEQRKALKPVTESSVEILRELRGH